MAEAIETQTAEVSPANDRAELEATVAEGLSRVFADDSEELENLPAETEKELPTPPHKREPEEKADGAVAETLETPEVAEDKDKPIPEAAPVVKTGPTLPAAYLRTLKAYEWTDEEITDALSTGGDKFVASAGKMHATRSKELQQFAAAGRAARQNPQQATVIEAATPVDVAALAKQYGDEDLIKKLAGPLNATVAQINAALPRLQAMEQVAQQAQLEKLGQQVDQFFVASDGVEAYGKTAASATPEQLQARMQVLELADALRAGGRQQGKNLNFDEALQLAYDATSTVPKQVTARKELVKTLTTRAKAVTLRPQTKAVLKSGPARSDLENNVRAGLAKVFK